MDTKHGKVSYKCTGLIVLTVLLLSAALCAALFIPLYKNREEIPSSLNVPSSTPTFIGTEAETECGKVKGFMEKGVHVFKGIPYADPPVGTLRWKPPKPKSPETGNCWTGSYTTTEFSEVCFQKLGDLVGSEDCLYLNVWTPKLDNSAQLPVLVYIHGGNLQVLSGGIPDGSPNAGLASDTQAVYVSFNYRLNVFGFLALDLLTSNSSTNSSGNYGFMDQLLVLNWVQRNIKNFGGNPSLVTLFGQSSGATSVMALLASPLSQGLFHRAWLMSSSVVLNRTLSQASTDNLIFLDNTNCTDLQCLYDLSPVQLVEAIPYDVWPRWSMDDLTQIPTKGLFNGALAIIDGHVLTDDPLEIFRSGRGMNVPVIVGTTAQETDMDEVSPDIRSWTWDNYTEHVTRKLQPFGDDILRTALELYPQQQNITPEFQLTSLSSDVRVNCPNDVLANTLASSSTLRVYRYVVTSFPAHPFHWHGSPYAQAYAFHGWDLIVFFGSFRTYFPEPSQDNLNFQRLLRQNIMYFARNGFPYEMGWLSYPETTRILSDTFYPVEAYHSKGCEFWLTNGFFSYGWIN